MKNLAFVLMALIGLNLCQAQSTEGVTITVSIDNIVNDNGKVMVALHSKDTFMKGAGIKNQQSTIEDGKVFLAFKNVMPGTYAIMAMHDANDNNRMDFESNGMPKESYGMSGNDMTMGPPNFESAKFVVVDKSLDFTIKF